MKILETDRLALRQFTPQDAPFILDLLTQPSFLRFIGERGVHSLPEARQYILNGPLDSYTRHGFGLYQVELKETHTPIGMCGLIKREVLADVDIGFAFLPQYESQGYGYESASAIMAYGKEVFKLKRIIAIVSPNNERSIKLLEKIGLKFESLFTWPEDDQPLKLYAWET
jgi:ribosomal-protein-alanine N-acetyltransferase